MAAATVNKKRRQQKMAIGGALLLVALLAIQVPRTMKMLKGAASTPVASAPGASEPASAAEAAPVPVVQLTDTEPKTSKLPRGDEFGRKDPFAARTGSEGTFGATAAQGEPGFRLVASAAPADVATPAATGGTYTVVLRSVPLKDGRGVAAAAAAKFRRQGISGAGVLVSSRYASLQKGYFVVHGGRFDSRLAALQMLLKARRAGADNPYVRPLKA
jgi:hypothetical protein